ncbi:MAG: serine hydrolase domain-containing protein [Thermoanaerobaculia bacterium]
MGDILTRFLLEEIEGEAFPGASALVGSSDAVLEEAVAGAAAVDPSREDLTASTLFDLASLTKPLCTAALLASARDVELAAPPGRFFPAWKRTRYAGITLEHLLTHTSGLSAWFPLYARGEGAAAYRRTLGELEPEAAPGSRVIYSDLNFLLLGEIAETLFSAPLDASFASVVAEPASSGARFLPERPEETAATERGDTTEREMTSRLGLSYARFRTGVVRGEVHDGNAFRRGGVAGNAGLFGTARDVWALARPWLEGLRRDSGRDRTPLLSEARGLGWQGARGAGSAIDAMSPSSFGHTGFTGTSLWLDPEHHRIYVLLTNRVHPEVREVNFNAVRRRFHGVVCGRL